MSVMTLTYDRSVSPDKYAQSAMSEKPVKYAIDPSVGDRAFKAEVPDLYVVYRSFGYFPVNGYLSHCMTIGDARYDVSELDLSCTRNTFEMDDWLYDYSDMVECVAPGPDEFVRMQWISDLLSDVSASPESRAMLRTRGLLGSAAHRTIHRFVTDMPGIGREECYMVVSHPKM